MGGCPTDVGGCTNLRNLNKAEGRLPCLTAFRNARPIAIVGGSRNGLVRVMLETFCSYLVCKTFVEGNERSTEATRSLTGRRRVARMQRMHREASSGALRVRYK